MSKDDFTTKIKRSKLSLDQAFSPSATAVDERPSQAPAHTDVQNTVHADVQTNRHTYPQDFQQPTSAQPAYHNAIMQDSQIQPYPLPSATRSKQTYKKKMTFNITEECYQRFQKLHANRLYHGRATEKGELIEECVNLLFDQEKRNGYITN